MFLLIALPFDGLDLVLTENERAYELMLDSHLSLEFSQNICELVKH